MIWILALSESSGVIESSILIGAISALATALGVVARMAYTSLRDDRDFLRTEILAVLRVSVERMSTTAQARDAMIQELHNKIDNLRRLVQRYHDGKG